MKKHFILLTFCFSYFAIGQNITAIKNQVELINSSKNYVVKKIPNDYFTDTKNEVADNGQELEGFYHKIELKKMVHSVGISGEKITTQFYFNKTNLIFVLRKKYRIINNNGHFIAPMLISESRFYFVNGNVINKIGINDMDEVAKIKQQSLVCQNDLKIYK